MQLPRHFLLTTLLASPLTLALPRPDDKPYWELATAPPISAPYSAFHVRWIKVPDRDITGDQKEKFEVKFKRSKDPDSAYITCSGDVGISSSTPICPYGSIGRVAIGLPDDNPDGRGMANARDLGFSLFMDWQMENGYQGLTDRQFWTTGATNWTTLNGAEQWLIPHARGNEKEDRWIRFDIDVDGVDGAY